MALTSKFNLNILKRIQNIFFPKTTVAEKLLEAHLQDAQKIKPTIGGLGPEPPPPYHFPSCSKTNDHRLLEKSSTQYTITDSLKKIIQMNPFPEPIKIKFSTITLSDQQKAENMQAITRLPKAPTKSPTYLNHRCYSSSEKEDDCDFDTSACVEKVKSPNCTPPKCVVCKSKFKIKRCRKLEAPYYSFAELLTKPLRGNKSECRFCHRLKKYPPLSTLRKKFHTSSLQPNIFNQIDALNQVLYEKPHPFLQLFSRDRSHLYMPDFPQLKNRVERDPLRKYQKIKQLSLHAVQALELLHWQISNKNKDPFCAGKDDCFYKITLDCCDKKLPECKIDDAVKKPPCPPKPPNTKVCPKDLLIKKKKKINPNHCDK